MFKTFLSLKSVPKCEQISKNVSKSAVLEIRLKELLNPLFLNNRSDPF